MATGTLTAGKDGSPVETAGSPIRKSLLSYATDSGTMICGKAEQVLTSGVFEAYRGEVQLIFTSPPFPLNRKKRYGNLRGEEYTKWLASFAPIFRDVLKPNGSIVVELGNAWEPGQPIMSTLALKALLAFQEEGDFFLCQQFVAFNRARLPSPAQWVNVERIRVKDAYTHIWWMSPSTRPEASNRRVLKEYSTSMKQLLRTGKYNAGRRPSEHSIGKRSFNRDNGGAIPSNVLEVTNTLAHDPYMDYCRAEGLSFQPSRMPMQIPEFFIRLTTAEHDLVLDPFAGSNTTGGTAERLNRRWVSIEPVEDYVRGSTGRFPKVRRRGKWSSAPRSPEGEKGPIPVREP
jgi:site-specific DNA-methyltransferase (cytosine-N4-specific)